jgi:hypothetical protein
VAREFVHNDLAAGADKPDRCGKPGKTCAHDMHRSIRHQMTP